MRPINKGDSPYDSISEYRKALPYLKQAVGLYCSYCELPILNAPEVEHVVSKSIDGELTAWSNLLLGCKYCNTRKSNNVTKTNKDEFLWPDEDNTALAFSYEGGRPKVNSNVLDKIDASSESTKKAKNLYNLIKLGNIPCPSERDQRFSARVEAYEFAIRSLRNWNTAKKLPEYKDAMKDQIIITAKSKGFFSIWMTVFSDEPEMLVEFINEFPGTNLEYFDSDGKSIEKIR